MAAPGANARKRAREVARDLTPPALLRVARTAQRAGRGRGRGAGNGAGGGDELGIGASAGAEQGADFYNARLGDEWKRPYWEMRWFGSWSVIADRVERDLGRDASVLDMGCGAGHLAALLHDRGVQRIVGFDFSETRIRHAREHVDGVEFHVADAYTTDLLDRDDYDVVVTTEFLEHVEGDLEILKRVRPGVRVIGTVPDYDSAGHVRFFRTQASVEERFGPVLDGLRVDKLRNTTGSSLWLVDGTAASR